MIFFMKSVVAPGRRRKQAAEAAAETEKVVDEKAVIDKVEAEDVVDDITVIDRVAVDTAVHIE